MDEQETVERREAVLGISLLGVLLLALVGTIFYRIVNPTLPAKVSLESLVIAPQPGQPEAPLADSAASAVPGDAYQIHGNVSAATFSAEPSASAIDHAVPTFVAPAAR
jgi:hypothetical protein